MSERTPSHSTLEGERQAFLAALARTASPATVSAYRRDLEALAAFLDERGIDTWTRLDVGLLRRFLGAERSRGLAPRSLARRRAAISRFAAHLVQAGLLAHNPVALVRAPRQPRHLPKPLDVDQLAGFLDTPHDGSPLALRDQAMLELFYSSGLRLAELAALDINQLQPQRVRVLGKGGKPRQVPVGRRARQALDAWLAVRDQLAGSGEAALFVGVRGARLGHRAIQKRLDELARRRGLAESLHLTGCAIPSPVIYWSRARTCAPCRSCSAMPTSRPPRSTHASTGNTWRPATTPLTLGPGGARVKKWASPKQGLPSTKPTGPMTRHDSHTAESHHLLSRRYAGGPRG